MMKDKLVKVFFVQKNASGEFETESLWCKKSGKYFIVDSIPFITKRIALGDIIKAEYDTGDKCYYFDDFISTSGNSTIQILLNDIQFIDKIREELNSFECESEVLLQLNIIAVNVPAQVNYLKIKQYLDFGEQKGLWVYGEICLSHEI